MKENGVINENGLGVKEFNDLNMPKYQCHKKVMAFKITDISEEVNRHGEHVRTLLLLGAPNMFLIVSGDYITKHNPEIGGYYVRYQDGYESYSPAGAFEEGYSLIIDEQPKSIKPQGDSAPGESKETIIARMACASINEAVENKSMSLIPAMNHEDEENPNYVYTTYGHLNLTIRKETKASDFFKVGKKYLVYIKEE